MQGIDYLYEVFESLERCGPGANEHTRRAFQAIVQPLKRPFILDIGCGTGVQTIELARISNGTIIALDNHQPFLDKLMEQATRQGVEERIIPRNMSMLEMDFGDKTFDIIWSEGALYFMGFQNGLKRCRQLLKDRGYLAVSELVYTAPDPPDAVIQYLEGEYPDIRNIEGNIEQIQKEEFELVSHFTLPESAWMDNYYLPMEKELPRLKEKHQRNEVAIGVLAAFEDEINYYKKYSKHYGYEFFVVQKSG